MSFVIWALSFGSAIVGTVEALAASYVRPWWFQMLTNVGLTVLAFAMGSRVFAFSHDWVLRDSRLEKPMWAIELCVIS